MKIHILITFFITSLLIVSCEKRIHKNKSLVKNKNFIVNKKEVIKEVIKELEDPSSPELKKIAIKTNTMYECGYKNKAIGTSWNDLYITYTLKSKYILREKEHTMADSNACELNKFNSKGKEMHFRKQQHKTDSYHCRAFFIKRFIEDKCVEAKLNIRAKLNIKANVTYECGADISKRSIFILREDSSTLNDKNICELNQIITNPETNQELEQHLKGYRHNTEISYCRDIFINRFTKDKCIEIK